MKKKSAKAVIFGKKSIILHKIPNFCIFLIFTLFEILILSMHSCCTGQYVLKQKLLYQLSSTIVSFGIKSDKFE